MKIERERKKKEKEEGLIIKKKRRENKIKGNGISYKIYS